MRFQVIGQNYGLDGTDGKSVPDFFENHIVNVSSPDSHGISTKYQEKTFSFRVGDTIKLSSKNYRIIDVHFEYYPMGFNAVSQEPSIVIRVMLES